MDEKNVQEKGFALVMKEYFGLKPDQNNTGFTGELKGLDDKDRLWFADALIELTGVAIKGYDDIKVKASGVVS